MNAGASLRTNVRVEDATVVATLVGTAESVAREQLSSFIDALQGQVTRCRATRVIVDVRRLEFATASCLEVLSVWILSVAQSAPYTIEFLSTKQHAWQRRSLAALAACAPTLIQVRTS